MKTYVISATTVATSVLFFDPGILPIASADLPESRVYEVPEAAAQTNGACR
jgi:hypothetical protein